MAVRRLLVSGMLVAAGLALGTVPGAVAQAGGTYVVCAPSVNDFVWDGGGDGVSWNDAPNWDVDCTPGLLNQPVDDSVVIGSGETVQIDAGESAYVLALDNQGTLVVDTGGVLQTVNDSTSAVTQMRGLLYGAGRFVVTDTLTWESTPNGASTMSTRRCSGNPGDPGETCPGVSASPGTTVVEPGASLDISGRGVNLQDGRVIENHGTVTLSGDGYIAADYGTAFRNQRLVGDPQPHLTVANDRGYYQGFAEVGSGLSEFTNSGQVEKTAGTGTSVIDADYSDNDPQSADRGTIVVRTGRLTVLSSDVTFTSEARVRQGSAFADGSPGSCAVGNDTSACETIRATSADPQSTAVELVKPGKKLRTVSIRELTNGAQPGGFGNPVRIETPNAAATNAKPIVLSLILDASILGSSNPADVAKFAKVQRKATSGAKYRSLPDCASAGGPSATRACVARAQSLNETVLLGGDVVLVVKTLQNSRYRVGRIPRAT